MKIHRQYLFFYSRAFIPIFLAFCCMKMSKESLITRTYNENCQKNTENYLTLVLDFIISNFLLGLFFYFTRYKGLKVKVD